jgi:uncharacterized protein YkwD
MKQARLVVCAFLLSSTLSNVNAQVYSVYDYATLIKTSERDSVAKIERFAALEFHRLINDYRKSKKLDTIAWNETLWIASRNHCVWMMHADNLTHHQKVKTSFFTGQSPGDRYDYAAGGSSNYAWSGENALYNFSANGSNVKDIANNIAKTSFEQWKRSTGHNQNMLNKTHGMHGVAFVVTDEKVWGTDLFASCNDCPNPQQELLAYTKKPKSVIVANEQVVDNTKTQTVVVKTKPKKINVLAAQKEITEKLVEQLTHSLEFKLKKSAKLEDEAYQSAQSLLSAKLPNNKSEDVLLSQHNDTKTWGLLGLFSKEKSTYSVVMERSINDFDADTISAQLSAMVKEHQLFSGKRKMGLSVALRKKKDVVRITMVSVLV